MDAYHLSNRSQDDRRLTLCFLWAVMLHGCILLGVGMGIIEIPLQEALPEPTMTVSLIKSDNTRRAALSAFGPLTARSPIKSAVQKTVEQQNLMALQQQMKALSEQINAIKKEMLADPSADKDASAYIAKWQAAIENLGNKHYPEEAKRNNIQGELRLLVRIKSDGQIQTIEVRQSSGYDLLDKAAIDIVQQASPFEPFPQTLAQKQESLDIIRIWQFNATQIETQTGQSHWQLSLKI